MEDILDHRLEKGKYQFLARWRDTSPKIRLGHFFHQNSSERIKYAKAKGLSKLPILQYLSASVEVEEEARVLGR